MSLLQLPETDSSRWARLRRELRNPSMLTVMVLIMSMLVIPMSFVLPQTITTAEDSFSDLYEGRRRAEDSLISENLYVPSLIRPWLNGRVRIMQEAENLYEWTVTDFSEGGCNHNNLAQLSGEYAFAISQACSDVDRIQREYTSDCTDISCDLRRSASLELQVAMQTLDDVFADAGYSRLYE